MYSHSWELLSCTEMRKILQLTKVTDKIPRVDRPSLLFSCHLKRKRKATRTFKHPLILCGPTLWFYFLFLLTLDQIHYPLLALRCWLSQESLWSFLLGLNRGRGAHHSVGYTPNFHYKLPSWFLSSSFWYFSHCCSNFLKGCGIP
jgi:hypothetical protein